MDSAPLRFALRRLRRQLRAGENIVLMLALAIAVAATSAVGLFSDRVRGAIVHPRAARRGRRLGGAPRRPCPAGRIS